MCYDAHNMCRRCTTAHFGIIHRNQFGYSNHTLRLFISNLATASNTWRTAAKESAKQQAANRGPKLPTLWKAVSGQQRPIREAIAGYCENVRHTNTVHCRNKNSESFKTLNSD
jgi:hypothetical protein